MCWRCSTRASAARCSNVARALPPAAITHATALPVRQFISSGDADQEVGDDGTFRRLFIDALQGAEPSADINKDGYLTGTGLGQFLYNKMTNLTGQRQTPRYGKLNARGYDRGDFVFQVREAKPNAAQTPKPTAEAEDDANREWAAMDKNSVAMLKTFLRRHGSSRFADYAQARIEELNQLQTAVAAPQPPRP